MRKNFFKGQIFIQSFQVDSEVHLDVTFDHEKEALRLRERERDKSTYFWREREKISMIAAQ